jgi:hypothetical protein
MIRASYPVLAALHRFCSEPHQISVSGRSLRGRKISSHSQTSLVCAPEAATPSCSLSVLSTHSAP